MAPRATAPVRDPASVWRDLLAPRPADAPPPTPTPITDFPPPTSIAVPAVGIATTIIEVAPRAIEVDGRRVFEWPAADWAAGHHSTSASPGEGGNIVIAGHDDVRGEVFRGLHDIKAGDQVTLESAAGSFIYVVQEIHLRFYNAASLDEQLSVATFIAPMPEERLTLITCWPYGVDTHRLIVVARPLAPSG
jgi:sortase A